MDIDNITYHVLHEGNPSNPLIILCHVLMSNLHMWNSTVVALHAAGYSTLRYDHIGHGKTTSPPPDKVGTYHFDDLTRHIHEMVQRTVPGRKPYGFIGCSMGGVLALRYALMYPGQLTKVVSCDAPGMTSLAEAKGRWRDRMAIFREQGVEVLARATVERWFPPPCREEVKMEALGYCMSTSLAGYVSCAEGIMNYDYTAELGGIQSEEVLVLAGENDEAIGPRSVLVDVARRVRGARLVVMRDTGHVPPMHWPGEFEGLVIPFLRGR